jgi:hypothetical protein
MQQESCPQFLIADDAITWLYVHMNIARIRAAFRRRRVRRPKPRQLELKLWPKSRR